MQALFLNLLNMSITASWLVLAVVLFRVLFKKAPKYLRVALWALVGIRLIFPFSIESAVSLIPSAETVPVEILDTGVPAIQTGIPVVNTVINNRLNEMVNALAEGAISSTVGSAADSGSNMWNDFVANPAQLITRWATIGWIVGMAAMLLYTAVSYLRIARKVREAVPAEDDIWLCDHISTPFILGVLRPRIYLPSAMAEQDMEYVIAHERAHLKRRDHWWKPLGFLLLTVYWFNPVMWVAYVLLCRDIELACDERVIREMGAESKKSYSDALINCSVPRRMIAACPLAFGEVSVKGRIKSVLNYKKPGFWVMIAAVIVSIVVAVCFLTDPPGSNLDEKLQVFIDCEIANHNQSEKSGDYFCCLDWEVLGNERSGSQTTVYLWTLYQEYSNDNGLKVESGSHVPVAITVDYDGYAYELVEYWTPRDGSYYADDIRDKFPAYLWGRALDSQRYIKEQSADCERLARAHFALLEGTADADETGIGSQVNLPGVIGGTFPDFSDEKVVRFEYKHSVDPMNPYIVLNPEEQAYKFVYSGFSSYIAIGKYLLSNNTLILKDGEHVYRFNLEDGNYVFDASESFAIPKYNYGVSKGIQCPVPDGAVFEWVSGEMPVSDSGLLLEEPPELNVVSWAESVTALQGGYTWNLERVTEMEGYTVIACGSRMSENIDMMEALDLMPSYLSAFDSLTAVLQFAVEPDSITAVCWNLDEEDPEEEPIEIDGSIIKLKDGNYVYEIKAEWTRFARFNGSAEYGFYTQKPTMETHPIPENN